MLLVISLLIIGAVKKLLCKLFSYLVTAVYCCITIWSCVAAAQTVILVF
jgi:hypothetical protein